MAQYFVQGSDNMMYGPVDEAGLVQWAREGRLCDRINDQRAMRGLPPSAPRGLAMASCILMCIPYVNFLVGALIVDPIFVGMLQASVNELVLVTARQSQPAYAA